MSYDSKLNLNQRLLKVMESVDYVKKDVTVPGAGRGVARDAVVAEIRKALIANGVLVSTSQVGPGRYLEVTRKSASGTPMCSFVAMYATTFANADVMGEERIVCHEAQGDDYGDKAPGKAATYAEKLNLVKGLLLETGLNDEGRNPGEGDASPVSDNGASSPKGNIKPPKAKEPAAADDDSGPASAGLLKMFRSAAEAKGMLDKVDAAIAKRGDKATKNWVAAQMKRLADAPEREPGSDG